MEDHLLPTTATPGTTTTIRKLTDIQAVSSRYCPRYFQWDASRNSSGLQIFLLAPMSKFSRQNLRKHEVVDIFVTPVGEMAGNARD